MIRWIDGEIEFYWLDANSTEISLSFNEFMQAREMFDKYFSTVRAIPFAHCLYIIHRRKYEREQDMQLWLRTRVVGTS